MARVALETKLGQVCFDNQKNVRFLSTADHAEVRPTCLYADKNLSTETSLQRSRSPATNQDFLETTNKKCFSWDKIVDQFQKAYSVCISLFRCD